MVDDAHVLLPQYVCASITPRGLPPHGQAGVECLFPSVHRCRHRYQVLVSIQSIIMVEQPVYNEPGVSGEGTAEGDRQSKLYNSVVIRSTIRFAMLEMLRKPVYGARFLDGNWCLINDGLWIPFVHPLSFGRGPHFLAQVPPEQGSLRPCSRRLEACRCVIRRRAFKVVVSSYCCYHQFRHNTEGKGLRRSFGFISN
jgi:hypothetical protein